MRWRVGVGDEPVIVRTPRIACSRTGVRRTAGRAFACDPRERREHQERSVPNAFRTFGERGGARDCSKGVRAGVSATKLVAALQDRGGPMHSGTRQLAHQLGTTPTTLYAAAGELSKAAAVSLVAGPHGPCSGWSPLTLNHCEGQPIVFFVSIWSPTTRPWSLDVPRTNKGWSVGH
jgi:hypothetical protein